MQTICRFIFILFILSLGLVYAGPTQVQAKTRKATKWFDFKHQPHEKMRVRWNGTHLEIQLKPRKGEGGYGLAKRVLNRKYRSLKTIHRQKGGRKILLNSFITFPVRVLKGSIRSTALKAIFSKDRIDLKGWRHVVTHPWETSTLIAGLFAKKGITSLNLASENKLRRNGNLLRINDKILIPWDWISPKLGIRKPTLNPPLVLKYDRSGGAYGEYRMKDGETLYSSVIIRFTGRMLHDEVNRMADDLIKLNGIKNPRRIRQNQKIRIPLEWLSEEFVNQGEIYSKSGNSSLKFAGGKTKPDPNHQLHVILDAGHGGKDPGAVAGTMKRGDRIYEDEAVYDISRRMNRILKKEGYIVHPTLIDPTQKNPVKRLNRHHDDDEYLNVSPHYTVRDSRTGVNMRIFLVNHIYQKLLKKKVPKENIIFMSVHGDALHSSLSGAMVYYPDHRFRRTGFSINRNVYRKRKEFIKRIYFPSKQNRHSEDLSRSLGKSVIASFRKSDLRTYRGTAVRGFFYRRGKKTLPAVLRYCQVPTSVLIEVANLNNFRDRRSLLKSETREKMARALTDSIRNYYQQSGVLVARN